MKKKSEKWICLSATESNKHFISSHENLYTSFHIGKNGSNQVIHSLTRIRLLCVASSNFTKKIKNKERQNCVQRHIQRQALNFIACKIRRTCAFRMFISTITNNAAYQKNRPFDCCDFLIYEGKPLLTSCVHQHTIYLHRTPNNQITNVNSINLKEESVLKNVRCMTFFAWFFLQRDFSQSLWLISCGMLERWNVFHCCCCCFCCDHKDISLKSEMIQMDSNVSIENFWVQMIWSIIFFRCVHRFTQRARVSNW